MKQKKQTKQNKLNEKPWSSANVWSWLCLSCVVVMMCMGASWSLMAVWTYMDKESKHGVVYVDDVKDWSMFTVTEHMNMKAIVNETKPVIWMFWDKGEQDMVTKSAFLSRVHALWKQTHPDFTLTVIDKHNVLQWLTVGEDLPNTWDNMNKAAHLKDIISVSILSKYGGIWVDCSVIPVYHNSLVPLWNHLHSAHSAHQVYAPKNFRPNCLWELQLWVMIAKQPSASVSPQQPSFLNQWKRKMIAAMNNSTLLTGREAEISQAAHLLTTTTSRAYDCKRSITHFERSYLGMSWLLQFLTLSHSNTHDHVHVQHIRARCSWDHLAAPPHVHTAMKDEHDQPVHDHTTHQWWFQNVQEDAACVLDPTDPFMRSLGYQNTTTPFIKFMATGGHFKHMSHFELSLLTCHRFPQRLLNPRCHAYTSV